MKKIFIERAAGGYIADIESHEIIIARTISELVENLISREICSDDVTTGNSSADNKLQNIFYACKTGDKKLIKMYQFEFEIRMP